MNCPKGFICINNLHFMYLSLLSLTIIYFYSNNNIKKIQHQLIKKQQKKIQENNIKHANIEPTIMNSNTYQNMRQVIDQTQYIQEPTDNVNDPLKPPLKREPYRLPINIKTRGDGGPYQQMGTLYKKTNSNKTFGAPGNNDKNIILSLYGKPTYHGSRLFNYYTISKHGVKLPLNLSGSNCTEERGCEEITDAQEIEIPEYNGAFVATIYKNDSPRYIPYI